MITKHTVIALAACLILLAILISYHVSQIEPILQIEPVAKEMVKNRCFEKKDLLKAEKEEAIRAFDKTIELSPKYAEARGEKEGTLHIEPSAEDRKIAAQWYDEGEFLLETDKLEEALKVFDKIIALDGSQHLSYIPYVWCNRGEALMLLGRHKEANESFDKAIEYSPQTVNKVWILKMLVTFSESAGTESYEESIKTADKIIEMQPTIRMAWEHKEQVLRFLGRDHEANETHNKMIKIFPNDTTDNKK